MNGLRIIDLEEGRPAADEAVKRLAMEIGQARRQKCTALKVIHGYGSSGKGGRIRTECRKYALAAVERGELRKCLPGETFSIFEEETRASFALCPALRHDRDLDAYNRGVTILLL